MNLTPVTPRKGLCYGFINEIDTMEKAGGVPILAGGVCLVPAGEGDRHRRQVYGVVGRAKKEIPTRRRETGGWGFFAAPLNPHRAQASYYQRWDTVRGNQVRSGRRRQLGRFPAAGPLPSRSAR